MALDDLNEVIEKLQDMVSRHRNYLSENETCTRQVLINPLLQELSWEVSDPDMVRLEYKVRQQRADYALMSNGKPIAVIEAKRLGKNLEDNVTTQVLIYANQAGIPYMIVTDGDKWEMYEVFKPVALEDRRLMKFQLSQQPSHEIALQVLRIWQPNLASGSPKEAMKPVLEPPLDKIEGALAAPPVPDPAVGLKPGQSWTGKKIRGAFTFEGETHQVKNWKDFYVKFFEILSEDNPLQFRDVLELKPSSFSENPDSFPSSAQPVDIKEIGETDIYVFTGIGNAEKQRIMEDVVEHFGLPMPVPHTD